MRGTINEISPVINLGLPRRGSSSSSTSSLWPFPQLPKAALELRKTGGASSFADSSYFDSVLLRLFDLRPKISDDELSLLNSFVCRLPVHRRTFFFTTVVDMFAHASFMLESFAETLAKVAENLASPKGPLPPEALQNFSCTPQQICGYTGGFFINALESGSLVRTRAEYEGKARTFYVKGFYAKSGNNLAFGPNNLFYSIVMSHGEILRATPETKYLPYGHYIWKRISASESIA